MVAMQIFGLAYGILRVVDRVRSTDLAEATECRVTVNLVLLSKCSCVLSLSTRFRPLGVSVCLAGCLDGCLAVCACMCLRVLLQR